MPWLTDRHASCPLCKFDVLQHILDQEGNKDGGDDKEQNASEVEAGGHFLGTQHTMRNFRTAFHRADVMDYEAFEQWVINGSHDTVSRANKKWKAMLAAYQAPEFDANKDAELLDFMQGRKREEGFLKK